MVYRNIFRTGQRTVTQVTPNCAY